jgi:YidC/Oxa1 family membrane protein insertase
MEEKRLFLAIALSLIVIISWSYWVSHFYYIEQQRLATSTPLSTFKILEKKASGESLLENISWNKNLLVFNPIEAAIKKVIFKDYPQEELILEKGLFLKTDTFFWQRDFQKTWPSFIYEDDKKRIIKEFIFSNINNLIDLKIKIQNLLFEPQNIDFVLILQELDFSKLPLQQARFYEIIFNQKEKNLRLSYRKNFALEKIEFLGIRNRYFCLIIEPEVKEFQAFTQKIDNSRTQIGLNTSFFIPAQETKELNFLIYIGPQELEKISAIKNAWTQIIHYGIFGEITKIILWILKLFYKLLHNWGLAIIGLSIFIYLLFYPLTIKQILAMKRLQALQPQIEEIKKLYQNNPQRLNKEILELYRKEKINPIGGCLPLILQIPIFFALYQGLIRFIEIKGQSFLWIKDLAEPDRLLILGKEINILPILLIIIIFLQQRHSQIRTSPQNEQQRMMSILFPLILGIIFYSLPSALVLYWLINSILLYFFQFKLK